MARENINLCISQSITHSFKESTFNLELVYSEHYLLGKTKLDLQLSIINLSSNCF